VGFIAHPSSSDEFVGRIRIEETRWRKLIEERGLKLDRLLQPAEVLDARHSPAMTPITIAVFPLELGHVLEVHAGDGGRHCENGRPGGELAGDGVLLHLAGHQARLEGEGQHLAQRVDVLLDAADMVADVADATAQRSLSNSRRSV
jgi:hypothetical protein